MVCLYVFLCTFAAVMKPQKLFYILLIIWVLADLLQAIFTPVHADEAYYALYGRFLDWGYYDHPPMVALLTALSEALFKGNLSIRFATALLHGGTVWLVWKTLPHKTLTIRDVWTFFAIAASLVMFSVYGFITTPDAPLLFFTALFFYLYKHYLSTPTWPLALALSVTLTAMLYSKYMAVLVAGFVLLSNLKLLKDPKVWTAVLIAVVLFIPHILWQIRNGFPSFQYHLTDRNVGFRIQDPLLFIPNQLLVFNPLCLCLALYLCWKERHTEDLFERAILFTIAGFILFFWVMTVKGHAEPHWTVAASIPMIILLWQELRKEQWHKWLMRGIVPVVGLLLVARIAIPVVLSSEILPIPNESKKWDVIHDYCGHTPVMMVGSFQEPSLYQFYTHETGLSLSSFCLRQTQFDIWQFDKEYQGKPVCFIQKVPERGFLRRYAHVTLRDVDFMYRKVESFQGANRLEATVSQYRVVGDSLWIEMSIFNPYSLDYNFRHPEFPTSICIGYMRNGDFKTLGRIKTPDLVIPSNESVTLSTTLKCIPDKPFVIFIDNGFCQSVNSKPIIIKP